MPEVRDLATHEARLCDPDGYRPACCQRCQGKVHVHECRARRTRNAEVASVPIRIYRYADREACGATWRILPGFLARWLQRAHDLAIVVVHHLRKNGAGRAGQALRGSGDLHAWIDSGLYLRHQRDRLLLRAEHRHAPACEGIELRLVTRAEPPATYLEIADPEEAPPDTLEQLRARALVRRSQQGWSVQQERKDRSDG